MDVLEWADFLWLEDPSEAYVQLEGLGQTI